MKYLFIFLGNKLISCDTIVPFAAEIKKRKPSVKIIFYTFDINTLNIIKKNTNLNHIINENGKLLLFGYFERRYFKLLRIASKIINILSIIFLSLIFKTINIHFRGLDNFPFNLIYLFNKNNTYLFESNCWGYSNQTYKADLLFYKNRIGTEQIEFKSFKNLVCFSKDWPQYNYAKKNKKNIYFIAPTRSTVSWLDEIKNQVSITKNNNEVWYKIINKSQKEAVVYILGYMGNIPTLNENTNGEILFKKTINFLIEKTNYIILLKPHAITDLHIINRYISPKQSNRIYIVYNHVAVLSNFCSFAISNYFSYAMADAWSNGCKVIEYSHYDPSILEMTNNNSIVPKYVDVFINNDLDFLEKTLNKKHKSMNRECYKIKEDDSELLINKMLSK